MQDNTDYDDWRGRTVVDQDGNKVGVLEELYVDSDIDADINEASEARVEWATVTSGGLLGSKQYFIPVSLASLDGEDIVLQTTEQMVKNAPKVNADETMTDEQERQLYAYYGQEWHGAGSGGQASQDEQADIDESATVGHDTSGPTTDDAMTRSEEELEVGTRTQEVGRVRLKKYIVTEHVTTTVPVQREEIRIEREPITDTNMDQAMDGPALSEEEHEVVLHQEVPVVGTKVVPKERIKLNKKIVQDQQTVGSDIRKEQIDVVGDETGGSQR